MIKDEILKIISEIESEVINIRRRIHQSPELGFQEIKTAKLISEYLNRINLKVETGIAKTGVVGLLENNSTDKTLLLRADMDALPIQEENDFSYSSDHKGVMHACGHDAHTAILLGTAMVLKSLEDKLAGNIKFLFQPAEEDNGGAEKMIKQGVLESPKVDAAMGLHVWGSTPKGVVESMAGSFMAASDRFELEIIGSGGHAAQPHNCVDPVVIAAQVIQAWQNIISRQLSPVDSAVISTCKIEAGTSHNVIPDKALLQGTVRSLTEEIREAVPEKMEQIIKHITAMSQADYKFNYDFRYPPVVNDREMLNLVSNSASEILGNDKVKELKNPSMAGEDFAYFAREVPSCFFFLGIAPEDKQIQHHQSKFKVDDDVLKDGIAVLAQSAIDFLA